GSPRGAGELAKQLPGLPGGQPRRENHHPRSGFHFVLPSSGQSFTLLKAGSPHRQKRSFMTRHIHVAPYSPTWPQRFQAERQSILFALGPLADACVIEHIGSTAVPGLAAKPIIDIMLGLPALNDIEPSIPTLKSAGFHLQPQMAAAMTDRHYFAKPAAHPRTVHLHAVALGNAFWRDKLAFRDALRADERLAGQYADLKRRLAYDHSGDRAAYTDAKSGFIASVLAMAAGKPHGKPAAR
ncbi:GrpB family protein, partial [Chromobacterium vaccinii]